MSGLKHILLPIDFSQRALAAVRYAAAMARCFHSSLTMIHIIAPLIVAWELNANDGRLMRQILKKQKDLFEKNLQAFMSDELREVEVKRMLIEGDPAQAIVDYACSNGVDLIVTPTRGDGIFRRFLLGSVVAKVLHDAPCPILTTVHSEDIKPDINWQVRNILCAVNPGSGDEEALLWAHNLASSLEARLSVVHAMPSLACHPETYYLESDVGRVLARDARDKIINMLSACKIPEPAIHIRNGSAAKVVRSVAQDFKADLVVIGRVLGKGNRGRLRTDSYGIIRESPCPVVSV
jgi:nucleotide-binding universal stress UspA family protein